MATKADGSVIIDVDLDLDEKKFEKDLDKVADKTGKLESAFKRLGAVIGAAFAIDKIVSFGKQAVDLASDLQEVQNVVDTTFGEEGAKVIESFAKEAATSFGLSELAAKQYTGTLGAMLKSMGLTEDEVLNMSQSMVGLAGDFASFYNLDPAEAFEKIRSGISGETEPLKQLGINMSVANLEAFALAQGIEKAYKEMTQAEQATLRYNYLMSVSADAQGDFAKTSDSLANQQRILQLNMENLAASLGKKLLPGVNMVVTAINGLLTGDLGTEGFASQLVGVVTDALRTVAEQMPQFLTMGAEMLSGLLHGMAAALPSLLPVVTEVIFGLVDTLIENAPLLAEAAIAFAQGLASGLVAAIPVIVEKVPEILDTLAEALDFTWISENTHQIFLDLIESIKTVFNGFVEFFTGIFSGDVEGALDGLSTLFSGWKDALIGIVNLAQEGFGLFVDWLDKITGGKITTILEAIKTVFSAGFDYIRNVLSGLMDAFEQILGGLITFISGVFTKDWDKAWEGVKEVFKGIWNGIVGLIEGAANLIIDAVNWLIRQLNKISFTVPDWVPAIGGKQFGISIEQLNRVQIPRLAQGAVIPPNSEFLAILGDQKRGTNIEAPLDTIVEAFNRALAENGGGSSGPIHVTLQVDKTKLGTVVIDAINTRTRAANKTLLYL